MTTREEMIQRWDAGQPVSSIEMGGIGPGYEQAIQVLVMEILRDNDPLPADGARSWGSFGEAAISRCDRAVGGFSGAQVGAARALACAILRKGLDACLAEVGEERRILVSRPFPSPPPFPEVTK